jgi:hypothetical protein
MREFDVQACEWDNDQLHPVFLLIAKKQAPFQRLVL